MILYGFKKLVIQKNFAISLSFSIKILDVWMTNVNNLFFPYFIII
jgi:hypothetical protein